MGGNLRRRLERLEKALIQIDVQVAPGFSYRLQPGDKWAPHPGGGIVVANPERKPLWCHMADGCYVQEWLEPAQP